MALQDVSRPKDDFSSMKQLNHRHLVAVRMRLIGSNRITQPGRLPTEVDVPHTPHAISATVSQASLASSRARWSDQQPPYVKQGYYGTFLLCVHRSEEGTERYSRSEVVNVLSC